MFSQTMLYDLYMLFVFATVMAFFWIIEAAWANDKRWIPALIILPATLLLFIIHYWEETRFRCFITALILIMIFIIGGLVGADFFTRIATLILKVSVWPYFAAQSLIDYL